MLTKNNLDTEEDISPSSNIPYFERGGSGKNKEKQDSLLNAESHYLSPIKFKKNSSGGNSEINDKFSSVSSQNSMFYMDKIEELIPEKKSVAEKIIKK